MKQLSPVIKTINELRIAALASISEIAKTPEVTIIIDRSPTEKVNIFL